METANQQTEKFGNAVTGNEVKSCPELDGIPGFQAIQRAVHANAVGKGWWENTDINDVNVKLSKLMLIVSEVAEGCEEARTGKPLFYTMPNLTNSAGVPVQQFNEYPLRAPLAQKPEGLGAELADVVIRCMDLAEKLGFDLGSAIVAKHFYNQSRPHRHGGKLA